MLMVPLMDYGDLRLPERYWAKVYPCPITSCWLWGGAPRNSKGYGGYCIQLKPAKITLPAHKVAWQALHGPVPDGLVLDHLCRMTCCVNPEHLRVVTHAVNILASPITLASICAAVTCCPFGHEYSPENTYILPGSGSRACRQCATDRRHARIAKREGITIAEVRSRFTRPGRTGERRTFKKKSLAPVA